MNKDKIFTAIFSLIVCTAVAGIMGQPAMAGSKLDFEQSDYDKDGTVSREEYDKRMADRFYFFDNDRDGSLNSSEASTMKKDEFKQADQNGDKRLTLKEYVDYRSQILIAADTDSNGSLSVDEVQNWKP